MGPMLRVAGTWVVTTALIVLGVNAAIEQVARDVSVTRPAPMTPSDVDEQLREQEPTTSTTTGVASEPSDAPSQPRTGEPATSTPSGSRPTTVEPPRPEITSPATTGGPPADIGSTTTDPRGPSGRPDERDDVRRP